MVKIKFVIFFLLIIFHQKCFAVENKIILKIDNEKISKPSVINKNLFVIKDNSIIKLN